MIEYIKGTIADLSPTQVVVEAAGVGYLLYISLNTYSALQGRNEAKVFAYEVIREDAHQLFGFAAKSERELFTLLISVSGIGGQTARMVLSAFTPAELADIISSEDVRRLKSVKGIGPKAAQRIIVDLRDKMQGDFLASGQGGGNTASGSPLTTEVRERADEAIAALSMLGFAPAAAQKVVLEILKQDAATPVEQVIKQALKLL